MFGSTERGWVASSQDQEASRTPPRTLQRLRNSASGREGEARLQADGRDE